jgi:hypothetical protein
LTLARRAGALLLGLGLAMAGCASWLPGSASSGSALRARLAELPEAPAPAARLLLISIAGLVPSAWSETPERPSDMPTSAALAKLGVAADHVRVVAPASAYPVHATLVTGRPPREHGVPADQRIGERGVRAERYWHASQLRGGALWQLATESRVPAAAFDWPVTLGANLDVLLPDALPTRRGERYADVLAGGASPAVVARVRDAGEAGEAAAEPGPDRDRLLVDLACESARSARPPALLLLRLTQTEPALVAAGPGTSAARAAFAAADAELTRLLACHDAAGLLADAAVVVVGDRAFEPVHSLVLANVALAEARLLAIDAVGAVESWSALARSNGGSAFVYARDETAALEARRTLEGAAARTGAFRVVPAAEMLRLGADPEAWFGLEAAAGFGFGDAARGPLIGPSAARGLAGRLQPGLEPSPAFLAFGRGFRRGVRVPDMSQLDVAPTLAAALGLRLEGAEGRALVGLLAGAPAVSGR